jgi:DHA1 family bicyclomycin/chloramphenicol resistance-like MFS transporter
LNAFLMTRFDPMKVLRFGASAQAVAGLALLTTALSGIGGLFGVLIPLFLYLFCLSLIRPNATVLALAPFKSCAGTASALMGSLQFVLAAGASMAMGLIHSDSAVPMAGAIAFCGVAGWLFNGIAIKHARGADLEAAKQAETELEPPSLAD